jgi:hypothetical protein
MKTIQIDASPKQLSRLRNGHKVRVKPAMAGKGFGMIVDPAKFDSMSRAFTKGSAVQMQLSPEELKANKDAAMSGEMSGQGIYTGGRIKMPSAKKVGKVLSGAAKKSGQAIVDAEKAVRKSKTGRAIVKKAVPLLAEKAVEGVATYAGADPATAKALGKIGSEGAKSGLGEAGYGLYAGMARGRGMCGGALPGPPSRMPELSSISIGGNLLARSNQQLPPAMQSNAMSANFHMNTQLPVQYQRGGVRFI